MDSFKERLLKIIIPIVGYFFLKFIYFSSKKIYKIGKNIPKEPLIMAVWHGELALPPFFYRYILRENKPNLHILISEHKDGEYIAKTMSLLGLKSIRGSSTRGGAKALIGAIKTLKNGGDIAITPDGPKGPRHSVADGIVSIAQKTNSKIVALSMSANRYWQFKSWDKFMLPKPFSTITFYASEPFDVNNLDKNTAKKLIYNKLNRIE